MKRNGNPNGNGNPKKEVLLGIEDDLRMLEGKGETGYLSRSMNSLPSWLERSIFEEILEGKKSSSLRRFL